MLRRLLIAVENCPQSQCQAPERTQPMGFGYVEGVTHDCVRHGTTTLFAALDVPNGAVLASCKPRHRHQEFLSFLREIDKAIPSELDVHCSRCNENCKPSTWTAPADSILQKIARLCGRITGTGHWKLSSL